MANTEGREFDLDTPKSKRKRTGFSCCVANCIGVHSDGLSLYSFPKESNIRRQWIKFVQVCRADVGPAFYTPNVNSKICERHFVEDCYTQTCRLKGKPYGTNHL